jgi:hypothetical protein
VQPVCWAQRTVVLLVGLEGRRYDEVAAMMNLPIGTVRSRVSRGRETLRMQNGAVAMRRVALLLTVASLLALTGCESLQEKCRKEYPASEAGYESCRHAVLQRENEQQDWQDERDDGDGG